MKMLAINVNNHLYEATPLSQDLAALKMIGPYRLRVLPNNCGTAGYFKSRRLHYTPEAVPRFALGET